MSLTLVTPVKIRIDVAPEILDRLRENLAYTDERLNHSIKMWKNILDQDVKWEKGGKKWSRHWFFNKNSRSDLVQKISDLKDQQSKTLLFEDKEGYWTYSGIASVLETICGEKVVVSYPLPEYGVIPWATPPARSPRWYQSKATELFAPAVPTALPKAVELATGLGKTFIEILVTKEIGLPTVVVTPTLNIAENTIRDFILHFGKGKVGQFFDGKKQSDKLITVAVAKSLSLVKPGDEHYDNLRAKKLLIVDESHTCPPDELQSVTMGLMEMVPYRGFVSGTQMRTDGLSPLLQAITGDVLLRMSVKDGVEQGFLSPPNFYQFTIDSNERNEIKEITPTGKEKIKKISSKDVMNLTRIHVHRNPLIYKHAVKLIHSAVAKGRRALVLVDEIFQFQWLLDHGLNIKAMFAHGGVTKDNKHLVPKEHHKSDTYDLIQRFDDGEFPVLVGTSCIGMGSDIKSVSLIVDLFGNCSETRIQQGVGRGTRLFENKKDFVYACYCVKNVLPLYNQGRAHREVLDDIYGPVKVMEAK